VGEGRSLGKVSLFAFISFLSHIVDLTYVLGGGDGDEKRGGSSEAEQRKRSLWPWVMITLPLGMLWLDYRGSVGDMIIYQFSRSVLENLSPNSALHTKRNLAFSFIYITIHSLSTLSPGT
jgi:hypothetical protein